MGVELDTGDDEMERVAKADAVCVGVGDGLGGMRVGRGVNHAVLASDAGAVGVTDGEAPGDSVAEGDAESDPTSNGGAPGPRTYTLSVGAPRMTPPAR